MNKLKSGFQLPTFLIDENICRWNIRRMVQKAEVNGLIFRPHFKTHQSVNVGQWFCDEGVDTITVSSVSMATFFARAGWKDITIAFPFNVRESAKTDRLAREIRLSIMFDMPEQAEMAIQKLKHPSGFFIKTDTGYHRSGVEPDDLRTIQQILKITDGTTLTFKGFLTHSGHTYKAGSKEEILRIHEESVSQLNSLKEKYHDRYPGIIISSGDTPSCSIADGFKGLDEIRPGNFVFYDLMQFMLGSCRFEEIAAAVICPVVSVYPKRNEALIYGGAVHLSKESVTGEKGNKIFGLIVPFVNGKWKKAEGNDFLVSLSQEHGIFKTDSLWAKSLKPGDLAAVIPVHSCLASDLLKHNSLIL